MFMKSLLLSSLVLASILNAADSTDSLVKIDQITGQTECRHAKDEFFEGYLQALIDTSYMDQKIKVIVRNQKIHLMNLPSDERVRGSVINFIKDIPGVDENDVYIWDKEPKEFKNIQDCYVRRPQIKGIWFPQMTNLFQPLVADPRNVTNILGYRYHDKVIGRHCANIALGENFGIYRWIGAFNRGDVEIGIEGGIWSVFNLHPNPNPDGGTALYNTDFYFGLPLSYASGKWSYRFRLYHISGHLGDEFMVIYPNLKRLNPSIEGIDLFGSYQYNRNIRIYLGPGAYIHSDPSYRWKPMYIQYGTELRFLEYTYPAQRLHGSFFVASHFRNLEELHWHFDGTHRFGYEIAKNQGVGRKFRIWAGYHHGYSLEGQFAKQKSNYWDFNFNYGF
jgi:hypothetical protein